MTLEKFRKKIGLTYILRLIYHGVEAEAKGLINFADLSEARAKNLSMEKFRKHFAEGLTSISRLIYLGLESEAKLIYFADFSGVKAKQFVACEISQTFR